MARCEKGESLSQRCTYQMLTFPPATTRLICKLGVRNERQEKLLEPLALSNGKAVEVNPHLSF